MNEQITLITKQQLVCSTFLNYSSNALHNDIWIWNATKFHYISHRILSGSVLFYRRITSVKFCGQKGPLSSDVWSTARTADDKDKFTWSTSTCCKICTKIEMTGFCLAKFLCQNPIILIGIHTIGSFVWGRKILPQILLVQFCQTNLPHWPTERCLKVNHISKILQLKIGPLSFKPSCYQICVIDLKMLRNCE